MPSEQVQDACGYIASTGPLRVEVADESLCDTGLYTGDVHKPHTQWQDLLVCIWVSYLVSHDAVILDLLKRNHMVDEFSSWAIGSKQTEYPPAATMLRLLLWLDKRVYEVYNDEA